MIWVLSVLLLFVGGGLANPVKGKQVSEVNSSENTIYETVKEMQKSIQILYSKIQVVENQLKNGEAGWYGWKGHL